MYQPRLGDPLDALDTPAMVVDVTLMEKNIGRLMAQRQVQSVGVLPR